VRYGAHRERVILGVFILGRMYLLWMDKEWAYALGGKVDSNMAAHDKELRRPYEFFTRVNITFYV
jgi:hypothetical protein